MDEARDASFLLTGVGMWVGKQAYLTADPMRIQERSMGNCPSHNRPLSKGERARMSTFNPVNPTTL